MRKIQKGPKKDDESKKIWKKNQDGKVVNSQPMNVADDRNAVSSSLTMSNFHYEA